MPRSAIQIARLPVDASMSPPTVNGPANASAHNRVTRAVISWLLAASQAAANAEDRFVKTPSTRKNAARCITLYTPKPPQFRPV